MSLRKYLTSLFNKKKMNGMNHFKGYRVVVILMLMKMMNLGM
jgi:hypothetical protein